MTDAVDLACFSYLASARLLTVDRYPAADTGTEVHSVTHSLICSSPTTGQHDEVPAEQSRRGPRGVQLR